MPCQGSPPGAPATRGLDHSPSRLCNPREQREVPCHMQLKSMSRGPRRGVWQPHLVAPPSATPGGTATWGYSASTATALQPVPWSTPLQDPMKARAPRRSNQPHVASTRWPQGDGDIIGKVTRAQYTRLRGLLDHPVGSPTRVTREDTHFRSHGVRSVLVWPSTRCKISIGLATTHTV